MLAGDKALGWALEQDDVAVFWKDQLPPDEPIRIPQDCGRLSFEYHIAPRVPRVEAVGAIDFEAANILLGKLKEVEASNEDPSWTHEASLHEYKVGFLRRLRWYGPASIGYRARIAEKVIHQTIHLTQLGAEAPNVEFTDNGASEMNAPVPYFLTRQFYVHPDPALAYFFAQQRYNNGQSTDGRGRIMDLNDNIKQIELIGHIIDPEIQPGPIEEAFTTGLALGYNPRDLELDKDVPRYIRDLS